MIDMASLAYMNHEKYCIQEKYDAMVLIELIVYLGFEHVANI